MTIDKPSIRYCNKCLVPSSSAVSIVFNDAGICSGCEVTIEKDEIDWKERKQTLLDLLDNYKTESAGQYDCVIPVSGGKDSYFQVHVAQSELGLNPLLVTYNSNNYTRTGLDNLQNMRDVFGADHLFFTPSINVLKSLNRLGMEVMGDMNWHGHVGIETFPIQIAEKYNVPLMFWGEHGRLDLGGMFSHHDFVEFTYRHRHEHSARGYEWYDMIKEGKKFGEILTQRQMLPWQYPTDEEISRVGIRGLYISNYFYWDANAHGAFVIERYGFKESSEPFERTYRLMSNLDDMHENGIHDYMKFVKFGYGRATDHTTKDVRGGKMTRAYGIEEVRKRDHIKPKDLQRWLSYVGWTEGHFDRVADSFRDPRVWWIKNGEWRKDNIWGEESSYGKVSLERDEWSRYYRA
jgi:N-acetyl sugar amidotransferase